MSRVRSRFALRCGLWLLLAAALQAAAGWAAQRRALDLEVSFWAFPNRPLAITLEQRGVLAGRRLAVDLFVDQNQFARIHTAADRTRVSVETPPLAPGKHRMMAKAGTEFVEVDFQVLSWLWLAIPAILVFIAIAFGLARVRRRRRPSPG